MAKYLTKVVEQYRVDSESEVEQFLKQLKADPKFDVSKYKSEQKIKKDEEYILFEVTKVFNDVAEPTHEVYVEYSNLPFNHTTEDEEEE